MQKNERNICTCFVSLFSIMKFKMVLVNKQYGIKVDFYKIVLIHLAAVRNIQFSLKSVAHNINIRSSLQCMPCLSYKLHHIIVLSSMAKTTCDEIIQID